MYRRERKKYELKTTTEPSDVKKKKINARYHTRKCGENRESVRKIQGDTIRITQDKEIVDKQV